MDKYLSGNILEHQYRISLTSREERNKAISLFLKNKRKILLKYLWVPYITVTFFSRKIHGNLTENHGILFNNREFQKKITVSLNLKKTH